MEMLVFGKCHKNGKGWRLYRRPSKVVIFGPETRLQVLGRYSLMIIVLVLLCVFLVRDIQGLLIVLVTVPAISFWTVMRVFNPDFVAGKYFAGYGLNERFMTKCAVILLPRPKDEKLFVLDSSSDMEILAWEFDSAEDREFVLNNLRDLIRKEKMQAEQGTAPLSPAPQTEPSEGAH